MDGVEFIGVLLHCFRLEADATEPAFMFIVVALATEGASEVGSTDCCIVLAIVGWIVLFSLVLLSSLMLLEGCNDVVDGCIFWKSCYREGG